MKRSLLVLSLIPALFLAAAAPPAAAGPDGETKAAALDFRDVVRRTTAKVFPTLVYVRCIRETREEGKKQTQQVGGSGVIVSPEGDLLTNWHVVEKAIEVRCLLYSGEHYDGEVLGSDKDTDLALVRLKRPEGSPPLAFAPLGDSTRLSEGDFVMALGAPWGMSRSVSIGIVSCTRRYLPECSEYSLWFQTDASISPGNSGGPLVNTAGEVVGINARGTSGGGDLGFAIPSEMARAVVEQIRRHGKALWTWTGLQLQPLSDFERNVYFDAKEGMVVAGTDAGSPARDAGFLPHDLILTVNGAPVTAKTIEDLPAIRLLLATLPREGEVTFTGLRGGEPFTISFTPREKGRVEGEELDCPRFDFSVKTINRFETPKLFFHRQAGVYIYGVRHPGNASYSGLWVEDILLEIDGKPVQTLSDVKRIHEETLANADTDQRVVLTVLRNGFLRELVIDFSRDWERE